MKTSNKLLLIFFITLVSLMLISDTILWSNAKRGVYGENIFGQREEDNLSRTNAPLQPFKVIKVETHEEQWWVNVTLAGKYAVSNFSMKDSALASFRQVGDTLILHPIRADRDRLINVYCPEFTTLILEDSTKATVSLFNQSQFTVRAGEKCVVNLSSTKFRSLDLRGGKQSAVVFNYGCEIDTLHMALGKGSDFRSNDVPFKQVDMEMDEWAVFSVDGRSIPAMKQVK